METTTINVTDSDLGRWFGIDGKAIKNQEQLDLAIIALAGLYGYKPARQRQLNEMHKYVYGVDEVESTAVLLLGMAADSCLDFLNSALPEGYKFDLQGMGEYDFVLTSKK